MGVVCMENNFLYDVGVRGPGEGIAVIRGRAHSACIAASRGLRDTDAGLRSTPHCW
jgi:hypothetical protein